MYEQLESKGHFDGELFSVSTKQAAAALLRLFDLGFSFNLNESVQGKK